MGNESSKPPVETREVVDPYPVSDRSGTGVSVANAQKCRGCILKVGANASTSVVRLIPPVESTLNQQGELEGSPEQLIGKNKMFIIPDKPFNMQFGPTRFQVTKMALYRPCPIRIENVQADAVLSLNDYSDPTASIVVLVPISSGVTFGASGDFVGRIAEYINAFIVDEASGNKLPQTVPVGNDWELTKLLPVARNNTEVSVGYFKYQSKKYERYVRSTTERDNVKTITYGWRPLRTGNFTTILLQEPVRVSYATSTYISYLPYAPSQYTAPPPPVNGYAFQKGACLTCSNPPGIDPAKLEEMQAMQKKGGLSPSTMVYIIVGLVTLLIGTIGMYYGLDFALKKYDEGAVSAILSAMKVLIMPRPKTPAATTVQ